MTGHEGEDPTEEKREPVREVRRRHQENEGIHRAEEPMGHVMEDVAAEKDLVLAAKGDPSNLIAIQ